LIETHTGLSIIKKLSRRNIEDHIKCNVFEIETERDLKNEINRLKSRLKELEKKTEELKFKESSIWGRIETRGVYEMKNNSSIHELLLTGEEVSTYKLKTQDVHKIRSKGNSLSVGKPKLVKCL